MLNELLGDVLFLSERRRWWMDFGKRVSERVLCWFVYFSFEPKVTFS